MSGHLGQAEATIPVLLSYSLNLWFVSKDQWQQHTNAGLEMSNASFGRRSQAQTAHVSVSAIQVGGECAQYVFQQRVSQRQLKAPESA